MRQNVGLERIVAALRTERDRSRTPLFQAMFMLLRQPDLKPRLGELDAEIFDQGLSGAKTDFGIDVYLSPDGANGVCSYDADLFDRTTIERMIAGFRVLLEDIAAHPDARISELALLDANERARPRSRPVPRTPGGRPSGSPSPPRRPRRGRAAANRAPRHSAGSHRSSPRCSGAGRSASTTTSSPSAAIRCWPRRRSPASAACRSANCSPTRRSAISPPCWSSTGGAARGEQAAAAAPRRTGGAAQLSPAQQRLWFLHRLEPESAAYNLFNVWRLRGPLAPDALRAAIGDLAARHEILRTRYPDDDGRPAVTVEPPAPSCWRRSSFTAPRTRPKGWSRRGSTRPST